MAVVELDAPRNQAGPDPIRNGFGRDCPALSSREDALPHAVVRNVRLFYKDAGAGSPLVLIPGFGGDSTAYNLLLSRLRSRLRVIAPDPRGMGRSDDAEGPLTGSLLAEDVRGLLDHLEIPRAALLGTSMGALVAGRFAALTSFYLKYFDSFLIDRPGTLDAASGYHFTGRKSDRVLSDRELIDLYRGAVS